MAKRASLNFDALKGSKAIPAAGEGETPASVSRATEAKPIKRGRGRPPVRDPNAKVFGMTLRIPGDLRLALRRLAEQETDAQGRVVSVHDVILQAVEARLARKGVKVET